MNDVIEMLDAKVPEDVIIGQISKANLKFNLSTRDVVSLTKAGASERVLRQLDPSIPISKAPEDSARLVSVAAPPPPVEAKTEIKLEPDPNDPDVPHTPGMYLYTEKNGQRMMVSLNKTVPETSRQKHTGVFGWAFYAFVPRGKAVIRTGDHQPVFYFYVGKADKVNGEVDSPGQLTLIAMDPQTISKVPGRRFLYAKQSHPFSAPIYGTDPKAMRFFQAESKRPEAFRLVPDKELSSGEYCFFFSAGAGGGSGGSRGTAGAITLWDFGID
ncbi:MAG: hypothetical protein ABSE86_19865 [Bryobacteraceae bacterium]